MSPAEEARATRIEIYADWIAHDVDGLTFNISHPAARPIEGATVILAEARAKVALALGKLDQAIATDKAAHAAAEPEHA